MTTYTIILSPNAEKQLSKLEIKMQGRITAVLERIKIRPYSFVKRLMGVPYFAARAGKHRIILDIKDNELRILVIEMGLRENIYKKL